MKKFTNLNKKESKNKTKKVLGLVSLLVIALTFTFVSEKVLKGTEVSAAPPDGVTLTVNSTDDGNDSNPGDGICETSNSGECTLRAAFAEANSNGNPTLRDIIEFNIPGAGTHTIAPSTGLFSGSEPILVDGYSQPGSSANTATYPNPLNGVLLIELDFSNLTVVDEVGLSINSQATIRGLVMNRNPVGIQLGTYLADDVSIYGNYFSTDPTGLIARPGGASRNSLGLNGSTNIRVGGSLPEERNLFGTNGGGIYIFDAQPGSEQSSGISIKGNYIGVGSDGITNLGSLQFGHIAIGSNSSDIAIGGPNPEDGNTLENSFTSAISIGNSGLVERVLIQNNRIVGSGYSGVVIGDFDEPYVHPQNISILGNSIYLSGGIGVSPGIDLVLPGGPNPNDAQDTDEGANNFLNYPEYLAGSEVESGGDTTLDYSLDVPAGDYRIEFFSSPTQANPNSRDGYQFLGYQNITSAGTGSQSFTNTLTGVGHQNITMTATEIRADLPNGFGATSEFGGARARMSDVGIEKNLLNPEDVAQGATLDYGLSVTNYGPEALDLSYYSAPLASSPIISDFMPEDLTPVDIISAGPLPGSSWIDVGNSDLTCLWAGPGSAPLIGMTAHPDYSVLACWYTGASGFMANNESIELTISAEVAGDSQLAFINFALNQPANETNDPDTNAMYNQGVGGADLLDGVYRANAGNGGNNINNFAMSNLPQDIDISAVLTNPEDVAVGAVVNYDVTLTNNGITGFDLAHYFSASANLIAAAYPADKLTLVGSTNTDVNCISFGPGSIAYWGGAAANHPNHQLMACVYGGSSQIIAPGQSYTLHLQMTVNEVDNFSTYFVQTAGYGDEDITDLAPIFVGSSEDVLDTLSNSNFARVAYIAGQNGGGDGNGVGGNQNGSTGDTGSAAGLSSTGQTISIVLALALCLMAASVALLYRKNRSSHS